jgi:DNA (cytosine-5)-methyltransferase 1
MGMNELSLFSGAGGGLLGTMLLGFRPIGYVEWDDYCQRVIAARIRDGILPDAPIFGNIKTFISDGYAASYTGMVDVITGGFPCQDISCAGSGKGITGERSGLWKSMADVIRIVRPRYVLVENSPMLTLRGLGTVLRDLAEMGFDARWGVFSAADVGAPHIRERIFILAHTSKIRFNARRSGQSLQGARLDGKASVEKGEGWDFEPGMDRVAYGLDNGLDRVAALGNGQVPQVVRAAWRLLIGGNHETF